MDRKAIVLLILVLFGLFFVHSEARSVKRKPGKVYPIPDFNCPKLPTPPPATDVRKLRFGNIKAVMALGDSITAGFAMIGYPPVDIVENRDYVYSIGVADGAMTIPNWLMNYNPNLQGGATSWTWPLTKGMWLDGGVSMAKVEQVPDQIAYLASTIKSQYPDINLEEDWKLLNLFIGANNICGACYNNSNTFPAFFEQHLRQDLQLIQQYLPRTFVNLIAIFNISGVWDAGQTKEYCKVLWEFVKHECGCLTTGNIADRTIMDEHSVAFNQIMYKLADEFASQNNPNFTVVVQPGISGLDIGFYGEEYLSELDCFHPSIYANEAFTYAIWNNMQVPPSQKLPCPDVNNIKILCPGPDTFIQ